MAIIDKTKQNWIYDRDESVSLGLKLPMTFDNGYDASTKTTLEAVKQNVLNLCSTELGERVMQPNLGVRIRQFLFEPFTEDVRVAIQNSIIDYNNTYNTITRASSSLSADWDPAGGIVFKNLDYQIRKGLQL